MDHLEYSLLYKGLIVFLLSSFVPITLLAFLFVRRQKKVAEFSRVVDMLSIAKNVAEFARNRVTEQYSARDFRLPMFFAWSLAILGLVSLLYGADMVDEHKGKVNFLLTGMRIADKETLQIMRIQNMAIMSIAFVGAFLWSAQNILYRLNAGDLSPAVYFSAGIRMTLAPILSLMISHLVYGVENPQTLQSGLPAIAFLVGWFPDRALIFLREQFPVIFRHKRAADSLPLNMIEGIHTFDRARLNELGITDAQNLANANFIELMVRTAFNPNQLIDWIGQARLYVYFKDDITLLRQHQIRTVYDMLAIGRNAQLLEQLAQNTHLALPSITAYCDKLAADPAVAQLLDFQKRLYSQDNGTHSTQ